MYVYAIRIDRCAAAQHAGLNLSHPFLATLANGSESYSSCTKNGITSQSYGAWDVDVIVEACALIRFAHVKLDLLSVLDNPPSV